jgi:hypothetical protein
MDRETLKSMRIENARTYGEKAFNAEIDAALAEPWRRLFWAVLALVATAALVAIALR